MKLLLDEMVTPRLGPHLLGHEVSHVIQLGWRGKTNGELLSLAEREGYLALITKDNGISYQQNLAGRRISLIIISPRDQTRPAVLALAPSVLTAVSTLVPGAVLRLP